MKFALALLACLLVFVATKTYADTTVAITDHTAAVAIAQQRHLPCYVLVGARWCGPCQIVERDCVPTLKARGVYLHLDCEQQRGPVRKLATAAGRAITALPTLVVIDAGKVTKVLVGAGPIKAYVQAGR